MTADSTKRSLTILVALLLCGQLSAQNGVMRLLKKVGTRIDSMSVSGLDRRYIDAPERPWHASTVRRGLESGWTR